MSLAELPQEILYSIGQILVDNSHSISSHCTVNKWAYQSLNTLLYQYVKLGSDLSVSSFCDTITFLRPDYSKYVVSLQIGPEWLIGDLAYYKLQKRLVPRFRPVLRSLVHLKHLLILTTRLAFDFLFNGLNPPFQLESFFSCARPSKPLLRFLEKQPGIKRLGYHATKTDESQRSLLVLCDSNPNLLRGLKALESRSWGAVGLVRIRPISSLTILGPELQLTGLPSIAISLTKSLTHTMVPITHICVTEEVGEGNKWTYFIQLLHQTDVSTSLKEIDVIQWFTPDLQNQALSELVFQDINPQRFLRFTALERFKISQADDLRYDVPPLDVLTWLTSRNLQYLSSWSEHNPMLRSVIVHGHVVN